jgi:hypothetical protein
VFQQLHRSSPPFRGLVLSICVHALAIFSLAKVSFPEKKPPQTAAADHFPTQIRIGDRLFFVSQIAPPDAEVKPRDTKSGETKPRETKPGPARRPETPKSLALPADLIAAAAEAQASKPAPRVFVPPEVKKNLITESTLIQPASPPDLVPPVTPLPSFRVWTAPILRRPPKQFIVPGRPKPPEPQQTAALPLPDFDLVHADPVVSIAKPTLVLPPTPPPVEIKPPVASPTATPATPAGNPVNIVSISDRPVAPKENVVVPAGNIVGKTGSGAGNGAVPPVAGDSGSERNGPAAGGNGTAGGAAATGASAAAVGNGAAPKANASMPVSGAGTLAGAPGRVILRPATGSFDVVVTQSSTLDQFPEGKGLLTGRPIYSVYVPVDSSKDWTLFFCVPGEKAASSKPGTEVVDLSETAPPIRAPYPTRIVRPSITVPAFYKYILVHGYVSQTGRVERLHIVRPVTPAIDQAILASLAGWEFRSATRDGVQIAVEFLLSIPISGL